MLCTVLYCQHFLEATKVNGLSHSSWICTSCSKSAAPSFLPTLKSTINSSTESYCSSNSWKLLYCQQLKATPYYTVNRLTATMYCIASRWKLLCGTCTPCSKTAASSFLVTLTEFYCFSNTDWNLLFFQPWLKAAVLPTAVQRHSTVLPTAVSYYVLMCCHYLGATGIPGILLWAKI